MATDRFDRLAHIDWEQPPSVLAECAALFDELSEDLDGLVELLRAIPADEHLAEMCEGYDFLHKLVLHDHQATGARVRLHLYRPGYFERPHNHRWTFASRILRGSYEHRIFGTEEALDEDTDPDTLTPIHFREERAGATYVLHHTSVHSVQAQADSISLIVRGPAAKRSFLILDRATGAPIWVSGAADESPQTRASKQLGEQQLANTIDHAAGLLLAMKTT